MNTFVALLLHRYIIMIIAIVLIQGSFGSTQGLNKLFQVHIINLNMHSFLLLCFQGANAT